MSDGVTRSVSANALPVMLEPQQWQQVLGLLSEAAAPWRITNPLLQAIAGQLGQQQQPAPVHQLRPVGEPDRA